MSHPFTLMNSLVHNCLRDFTDLFCSFEDAEPVVGDEITAEDVEDVNCLVGLCVFFHILYSPPLPPSPSC